MQSTKLYVDSRSRDWPLYRNANNFMIDLLRPLTNVKKINIINCTIPVYQAATWQEEYKHAAIVLKGYRKDIHQVLPNQYSSETAAIIPLEIADLNPFVYTFYNQLNDANLWEADSLINIPTLQRMEVMLISIDPLLNTVVRYPFPDDGFAVSQNWSMTMVIEHDIGQN